MALARGALTVGQHDQRLSVFLAEETLLPSCVGMAPHVEARGAPFCRLLRSLDRLFLLSFQQLLHGICQVWPTLPITKQVNGPITQNVLIDPVLISIIFRLLCLLSPGDYFVATVCSFVSRIFFCNLAQCVKNSCAQVSFVSASLTTFLKLC